MSRLVLEKKSNPHPRPINGTRSTLKINFPLNLTKFMRYKCVKRVNKKEHSSLPINRTYQLDLEPKHEND